MNKNNFFKKQKLILAGIITVFAGLSLYLVLTTVKKPKTIVPAPTQKVQKTVTKPIFKKLVKKAVFPEKIAGQIITLKKLSLNYAFDFFTAFSPTVRKFLEFPEKITFGEVEFDIRIEVDAMKKGYSIAYSIWDNKDEKLIGSIKIIEKGNEHYSDYHGQLSMWLNENYWGGGRIQEALLLISKAYFNAHPNTQNYTAHARVWNPRSHRTLEKFGFKKVSEFSEDGKVTQYRYELGRETIKGR